MTSWFTLALLTALAAGAAVLVTRPPRRRWIHRQLQRYARQTMLPLRRDVAEAATARLARIGRFNAVGVLLGAITGLTVFALSPTLRTDPWFLWLTVVLLIAVPSVTTTIASGRPLFTPAPDAVRIARPRPDSIASSLGPGRRWTAVVVQLAATVGVAAFLVLTLSGILAVDGLAVLTVSGLAALALIVGTATRMAENRVLARPRLAADMLQVNWDDAFRADALGSLRLTAAVFAWLPLGAAWAIGLVAAAPVTASPLSLFPWWGVPVLQVIYTLGVGRIPVRLRPAPRPNPTGSQP